MTRQHVLGGRCVSEGIRQHGMFDLSPTFPPQCFELTSGIRCFFFFFVFMLSEMERLYTGRLRAQGRDKILFCFNLLTQRRPSVRSRDIAATVCLLPFPTAAAPSSLTKTVRRPRCGATRSRCASPIIFLTRHLFWPRLPARLCRK